MKKNCFTSAALSAVAMLLLFAVSACTKDKAPAPSEAGGCYVTVSAGFPATKTAADHNESNGVYTLKFTEGDRLYVHGTGVDWEEPGDWHMAGYLAIDPTSISTDGKRAEFAGTLGLYEYSEDVYYLRDPITMNDLSGLTLDDCEDVSVCLIPAGATDDLLAEEQLNDQNQKTSIDVYVKDAVVESTSLSSFDTDDAVKLLMSSAVDVRGKYDKDKDCIILNQSDDVIFDVQVTSNLSDTDWFDNVSLRLRLKGGVTKDYPLAGYVTSGEGGIARFAISVGIVGQKGEAELILNNYDHSHTYRVTLGYPTSSFEKKVYKRVDSAYLND